MVAQAAAAMNTSHLVYAHQSRQDHLNTVSHNSLSNSLKYSGGGNYASASSSKTSGDNTIVRKLPVYPKVYEAPDKNEDLLAIDNSNGAGSRHGSKSKKVINMSRLQELNEVKLTAARKKMTQT